MKSNLQSDAEKRRYGLCKWVGRNLEHLNFNFLKRNGTLIVLKLKQAFCEPHPADILLLVRAACIFKHHCSVERYWQWLRRDLALCTDRQSKFGKNWNSNFFSKNWPATFPKMNRSPAHHKAHYAMFSGQTISSVLAQLSKRYQEKRTECMEPTLLAHWTGLLSTWVDGRLAKLSSLWYSVTALVMSR